MSDRPDGVWRETPNSESEFATIRDLHDCLSELIAGGFGDHPVQVLVVPDSTVQAIAQQQSSETRPALMIELTGGDGARLPVLLISTRAVTLTRTHD